MAQWHLRASMHRDLELTEFGPRGPREDGTR